MFSLKFRNNPLAVRLMIAFLVVGLLPTTVLAFILLRGHTSSLEDQAHRRLESIRDGRQRAVAQYLAVAEKQVLTFASNALTVQAMKQLSDAFATMTSEKGLGKPELDQMRKRLAEFYSRQYEVEFEKKNPGKEGGSQQIAANLSDNGVYAQYQYVTQARYDGSGADLAKSAGNTTDYDKLHSQFHSSIRSYVDIYGFYDVFLVEPKTGNVVYSVHKEVDFGTSLLSGPFASSGLGVVFRRAMALRGGRDTVLVDYEKYRPSFDAPAGFIAAPIYDERELVGVAILQMPLDRFTSTMGEAPGMDSYSDAYVVGEDKRLRTDSLREDKFNAVDSVRNDIEVDSEAVRRALSGESGVLAGTSLGGKDVLSAYGPMSFGAKTYAVVTETEVDQALAAAHEGRNLTIVFFLISGLVTTALAYSLTRGISRVVRASELRQQKVTSFQDQEIVRLSETLEKMAGGDLTSSYSVPEVDDPDLTETREGLAKIAEGIQHTMRDVQSSISSIRDRADVMVYSADSLIQLADQLVSGNQNTAEQSSTVASSTAQMSSNVDSVAAAAEEMSINVGSVSESASAMTKKMNVAAEAIGRLSESIADVAIRADSGSSVASEAAEKSMVANRVMESLGRAATEIGKVTEVIKRIAEKTNLLALNATIEAASAGEAGKGFAVVANEIKELANQCSTAAEDITERIVGVQNNTDEAVGVITSMGEIISTLADASRTIAENAQGQSSSVVQISDGVNEVDRGVERTASAIAEIVQGANDVSRNAGELAQGAASVSSAIGQVSNLARSGGVAARQMGDAARNMRDVVQQLVDRVAHFEIDGDANLDGTGEKGKGERGSSNADSSYDRKVA